jgi:DNA-binding Lrp family transcriptional regulator
LILVKWPRSRLQFARRLRRIERNYRLSAAGAVRVAMTVIFLQIKCELGQAYKVADELVEAEVVSEVYSTAGDFDLLVKVYVPDGVDPGHFVTETIQRFQGIKDTRTIVTFKAF